jgi:predicted DNA-binding transcriptional regulator YafY
MRADRLLSILLLLQVHQRVTARELAERLEVSERTIHRDMEALGAAGIPVLADRGAGGGWRLLDEYRTNLTGLNGNEIQALFLSGPPRLLADLGLDKASDAALIKLLAALPSPNRRGAEDARQRIYVDAGGWGQRDEDVPFLPLIQEAIWHDVRLRLWYQRADGTASERLVDPLGLVAKGSLWYLVAAVEGDIRTYRVSRVRGAELTDQPCARPADFDLAAYWQASAAQFRAHLPSYPATVRVEPSALGRVRQGGRYSRIEREHPPAADGWVMLDVQLEVEDNAVEYVLSFGPCIEVLAPDSLRERVIAAARAMVELYEQTAGDQ